MAISLIRTDTQRLDTDGLGPSCREALTIERSRPTRLQAPCRDQRCAPARPNRDSPRRSSRVFDILEFEAGVESEIPEDLSGDRTVGPGRALACRMPSSIALTQEV